MKLFKKPKIVKQPDEGDIILINNKKYLVIKAEFDGGGIAMFHDYYPDAWKIEVSPLKGNKFNSKAKVKKYNMLTNYYSNSLDTVIKIGKMKKTWI